MKYQKKAVNIEGWGMYQCDTNGVVYGQNGEPLSPNINSKGYKYVVFCKDRKMKTLQVHRIIALTFVPNPTNLPVVNHKDGNKQNNNVNNLEWVSRQQNCWHRCNILGKRTKRIKDITNGLIFQSQKSAALYYGVSECLIASLVKKRIKSNRKRKHFQLNAVDHLKMPKKLLLRKN